MRYFAVFCLFIYGITFKIWCVAYTESTLQFKPGTCQVCGSHPWLGSMRTAQIRGGEVCCAEVELCSLPT